MPRKVTTDSFITRAREVHGDLYDYSKTEYINAKTKVCIIDPVYGEFWQLPTAHTRGQGNPDRAQEVRNLKLRLGEEEFIARAREVHGDLYDYSQVVYVNKDTKVTIIDPDYGPFEQSPHNHMAGAGCPQRSHRSYKSNTEEFIERAREIHGDTYDYSKVDYQRALDKVLIIHPEHGEFWQTPAKHLMGQGHPAVGFLATAEPRRLTQKDFVAKATAVHGGLYDYSKAEYVSSHVPVLILDPDFGEFWQTPSNHIYLAQGNPKRSYPISKPHQKVIDLVESYKLSPLINDRTLLDGRELDVVVGNIAIEVDGVYWHSSIFSDKKYHQNKHKDAEKLGVKLLQFYDYEINTKWDIVSSMIASSLGKINRKVYARHCRVRRLDPTEYREFLNHNHLQGAINSSIRFGLYHGEELVSVMGASNRKGLTIDRFVSKIHTTVVGGFSKLLSQLKGTVRTHSANRYATGDVYKKHGFNLVYEHPYTLNYTDGTRLLPRENYQKHKLTHMKGYSPEKTADDILLENGIYPIYGAGTKTWEIEL